MGILSFFQSAWPWYIAGPLIGLTVPLLLILGNKDFGISSNLRHLCAMIPNKIPFLNYNWREGSWNLLFALGVIIGGFAGGVLLANPEPLKLSSQTIAELSRLGLDFDGNLVPAALFSWSNLLSWQGLLLFVLGGFLVGFGTAYAGGCTSGHAILGLANVQLPSLVATIGFFIGGLITTHFLLPLIFKL